MYEAIYDAKHRFVTFRRDGDRPQVKQKGLREPLLCDDCEGRIGQWEKYVAEVWRGVEHTPFKREGNVVTLTVDYARLKLFQMSVLWRAAIASDSFFEKVVLQRKDEESLRKLLLASDPSSQNRFGCMMTALVDGTGPVEKIIVQPTYVHIDTCLCYRFVFGSLMWTHVAVDRVPPSMKFAFVQKDGTAHVLMKNIREAGFLTDALAETAANNPNPLKLR